MKTHYATMQRIQRMIDRNKKIIAESKKLTDHMEEQPPHQGEERRTSK